ncbi:MAG: hypothetical protein JXR56_05805 [Candidatus Cloacimonetes bacterium]|nr:hypothetical protein [Candidatus Cloacimonadota bacterium]
MKKYLILTTLLFLSLLCNAEEFRPVPWKAASLSFIAPGAGQIYNQDYLKAGLFFAAEATFFGMSVYHHNLMKDYEGKRAGAESDEDISFYDDEFKYNYYRRNSYYWWLGLSIIASVGDAYVDATLFDFDENKSKIHLNIGKDNISLSLRF